MPKVAILNNLSELVAVEDRPERVGVGLNRKADRANPNFKFARELDVSDSFDLTPEGRWRYDFGGHCFCSIAKDERIARDKADVAAERAQRIEFLKRQAAQLERLQGK